MKRALLRPSSITALVLSVVLIVAVLAFGDVKQVGALVSTFRLW